eukprot:54913-Rhodomonas_salina.1
MNTVHPAGTEAMPAESSNASSNKAKAKSTPQSTTAVRRYVNRDGCYIHQATLEKLTGESFSRLKRTHYSVCVCLSENGGLCLSVCLRHAHSLCCPIMTRATPAMRGFRSWAASSSSS